MFVVVVSGVQLTIASRRKLTTSSTETGSAPYPLLQAVWDCEITDPAVRCSAVWCGGVLVVSSSPVGELTGSSWHLRYRPYTQRTQKGSGDVTVLLQWVWVFPLACGPRHFEQIGVKWWHLKRSIIDWLTDWSIYWLFDLNNLNLDRHVSVVSASCFYWLRQLRRSLDRESAATLELFPG